MKVCKEAFKNIEIVINGDAFFCCAQTLGYRPIGNIFESSFEEVWNSETAQKLRTQILNGSYEGCNTKDCYAYEHRYKMFVEADETMKPVMDKYPEEIKLMHDTECNANCIICREKIYRQSNEDLEKLNNLVETTFLPLLKDTKLVELNSSGDPFASRHNSYLIKRICETYPDIKFIFTTNAILSTPQKLEELGVIDKISKVIVSLHAASKKTYNKIVLNGNFDKAVKNIKFISKMLKTNKDLSLDMIFVVNAYNYREMQKFVDFCIKIGANCFFWEYRKQGFYVNPDYEKLAIHLPEHKDHNKFLKVLKKLKIEKIHHNPLHPVLDRLRNS